MSPSDMPISSTPRILADTFDSPEQMLAWRDRFIISSLESESDYLSCTTPQLHIYCYYIQQIRKYEDNHPLFSEPDSISSGTYDYILARIESIQAYIHDHNLKYDDYDYMEDQAESFDLEPTLAGLKFKVMTALDNVSQPPLKSPKGEYNMYNQVQTSFVIIKPDAVERGLAGELMDMIDQKGMRLIHGKMFTMTYKQIIKHYAHHEGKDFWESMVEFLTGGPSIACVYKGDRACDAIRQLIGQKHPADSPPGSIRGKYAMSFPKNLIHGADSPSDAEREMKIFFTPQELLEMEVHGK